MARSSEIHWLTSPHLQNKKKEKPLLSLQQTLLERGSQGAGARSHPLLGTTTRNGSCQAPVLTFLGCISGPSSLASCHHPPPFTASCGLGELCLGRQEQTITAHCWSSEGLRGRTHAVQRWLGSPGSALSLHLVPCSPWQGEHCSKSGLRGYAGACKGRGSVLSRSSAPRSLARMDLPDSSWGTGPCCPSKGSGTTLPQSSQLLERRRWLLGASWTHGAGTM